MMELAECAFNSNIFFCPVSPNEPAKKNLKTQNKTYPSAQHTGKILIVEDERLVAESIRETVEQSGYTVVGLVPSGEEAITSFKDTEPDLVLMDIRLKGVIDGIQTALVIQQTIRPVPILFLTAYSQAQFPHLSAMTPGGFEYLIKPYSNHELIERISKLLAAKS